MKRGRKPTEDYSALRGDDLDRIMHRLLSSNFWPKELVHSRCYTRLHDDHDGTFQGKLSVVFSEDGDAWVEINSRDHASDGLRFRMPMTGGGRSPRTRTALLLLAEAIRLDNLHSPIKTPSVCDLCKELVHPNQPSVIVNNDTLHRICAVAAGHIRSDPPETGSISIPIKAGMTRRGALATQQVEITHPPEVDEPDAV